MDNHSKSAYSSPILHLDGASFLNAPHIQASPLLHSICIKWHIHSSISHSSKQISKYAQHDPCALTLLSTGATPQSWRALTHFKPTMYIT